MPRWLRFSSGHSVIAGRRSRFDTVALAVQQALDHPGTRELMHLMSGASDDRMRRSLERRWQKYADAVGVNLPGEQLVVVGTKPTAG